MIEPLSYEWHMRNKKREDEIAALKNQWFGPQYLGESMRYIPGQCAQRCEGNWQCTNPRGHGFDDLFCEEHAITNPERPL